jgi:PAS domain S-box-containing protein
MESAVSAVKGYDVWPRGPPTVTPTRRQRLRREYLRHVGSPGFAVAAVLLLEILSWTQAKFINPAPVLLVSVVCAAYVGGMFEGLIAAGITVWYYAYFVSAPGTIFPTTYETFRQAAVFACAAPAVALMVGLLKQRAARIAIEAAHREREAAETVVASLTTSRQAEKASRAAEERYRGLFEGVVAGVFRTFQDGHLADCNQACVRILGYDSRHDVLHQNAASFYWYPTDREALIHRLEAGETISNLEVPFKRKDGSPIRVRMNARRMDEGSRLLFEVSIVDTTERPEAQPVPD